MKVALISADFHNDYLCAKLLMHMGATYYRALDNFHDYVYQDK